jgi:fucose permease
LYAEDASNVASKKSVAEEQKRFHTGQRNHDSVPFWPQLGPVVFLAMIFLINFIARIILSPLLPTIEKELGISHGQAGSFFFLISAGYVIGLLGSGFLASRSSHKITIVISTAGVGLALLGISVVSSLWAMRVGLFRLGVRKRPLHSLGDRNDHVVDRAAALGKSHCRP